MATRALYIRPDDEPVWNEFASRNKNLSASITDLIRRWLLGERPAQSPKLYILSLVVSEEGLKRVKPQIELARLTAYADVSTLSISEIHLNHQVNP